MTVEPPRLFQLPSPLHFDVAQTCRQAQLRRINAPCQAPAAGRLFIRLASRTKSRESKKCWRTCHSAEVVTQCLKGSCQRENHERNRTRPGVTMVIRIFCGSLIETRTLREDTMSRTIYKVPRRLPPVLTVVYRAMQIVRLLISW